MKRSWARAFSVLMLLACALPAAAELAREPAPPEAAIHLPFRGWGLTEDHQLVKIFGDNVRYTVWPYADLSGLPWPADWTGYTSNLASDPWNPYYLYITVSTSDLGGTYLYRFNILTLAVNQETYFPPLGWNWTALRGLGSLCKSSAGPGVVSFYSDRTQPTGNIYHVREITNTGLEFAVSSSTTLSRWGDNAAELFGGPHWFTTTTRNPSHQLIYGLSNLGGTFVQSPGVSDHPSGLLNYGPGAYYMSTFDGQMRLVTTAGTSTVLQYVQWGVPALPAPPVMYDLSNVAAHCRRIET